MRLLRPRRCPGRAHGGGRPGAQHQQRLAGLDDAATRRTGAFDDLERIRVRDRHHRYEARRLARDEVLIELDQQIARLDLRTLRHFRDESLTIEFDRVDADMQQDLGAFGGLHRHRVAGAGEMRDDAIAGGDEAPVERIDADSVAEHPAREDGVRHVSQCNDRAGQRCPQDDAVQCDQSGLLSSFHPHFSLSGFR